MAALGARAAAGRAGAADRHSHGSRERFCGTGARQNPFEQALSLVGWGIGRNVRIDYRWGARDNPDQARAYALEILREVAPGIKRVLVLQGLDIGNQGFLRAIVGAAQSVGVAPVAAPVRDAADIERVITTFAQKPDGGLIVLPGSSRLDNRDLIVALASARDVLDPSFHRQWRPDVVRHRPQRALATSRGLCRSYSAR